MRIPPRHRLVPLLALIVASAALPAAAQDSNYWDNQYGTKAELLGGVVVGAPGDQSATYYNPAWIALGTDPSLLVTTHAAEYSSLTVNNVVNNDNSPGHTQFRASPGFLSGRINAKSTRGWQLSWVYIEKVRFEFKASGLAIDDTPTITPEGSFWFVGETFRTTKTNEYWYGFSMARKLSDRVAVGISPYFAYRSTDQRLQSNAQFLDDGNQYVGAYLVEEFKYSHLRFLAKIGAAFAFEPVSLGLTLTTPGLGLLGSGEVYNNATLTSQDWFPDLPSNYLEANSQQDLDARWKSPLSLAVGASTRFGRTGVHVTAEWFNAISSYDVLDAASYRSQTTGELREYQLGTRARALINWGVAVDQGFPGIFSMYGGFRSDYSTQQGPQKSDVVMSTWNLWHASLGAAFQFLGIELTTGLEFSFGGGTDYRLTDFGNTDDPTVGGTLAPVEIDYRRLKGLIGLDLSFLFSGD